MVKDIKDDSHETIRRIYIAGCIFLSLFFIKLLYRAIAHSFFERDLLWFISTVSQTMPGLSGVRLIKFLVDPNPIIYGSPNLKTYAFLILKLFGPIAKYFIFASLSLHFASSLLLFSLCKKIGLEIKAAFFSAVTYLTLFAHFDAYMWPMAFQHITSVFFLLLVLNLYLMTEERIDAGRAYHWYYISAILANFLASFCRISILILPIVVFAHILLSLKDGRSRVKKLYMWLPLFLTYLAYPLISVVLVGDVIVDLHLPKIGGSIKYISTSGAIVIALLLMLARGAFKSQRTVKRIAAASIILFVYIAFVAKDVRNILLPYNLMAPFVGLLASFLTPLQNVLLNDSARSYHYISLALNAFSFFLTLVFIIIFFRDIVPTSRQLLILLPWYSSVIFIGATNPIVSRYFIYISPVFAIIFCSVFTRLFFLFFERIRLKTIAKELILTSIIISLCASNTLAIGLELWRGKLANNFMIYDYIKIANAVKGDIERRTRTKVEPGDIAVRNVDEMGFEEYTGFPYVDTARYDEFKFVFAQVFNDASMSMISVNEAAGSDIASKHSYRIDGEKISGPGRADIEQFSDTFARALSEMKNGNRDKAKVLFQEAVDARPFLLNYILEDFDLQDLKWVTDGADLRTWTNKVIYPHKFWPKTAQKKVAHIARILNGEIDDYVQCIFYASYLCYLSGEIEESESLFYKLRFLESDYSRLFAWLSQTPTLKYNEGMMSFLTGHDNLLPHIDLENTYEFERFLFKFVSGIKVANKRGRLEIGAKKVGE